MPPRNNPLPNAVNVFHCDICEKGYPRQVDYENHLRSYDHNHRTRARDLKKLTAANDTDSSRPSRGPLDMRAIPVDGGGKKPGLAKGFTKIGGGAGAGTGGSRFKKVGKVVAGSGVGKDEKDVGESVKADVAKDMKVEDVKKDIEMADAQKVEPAPSTTITQIPVTDAIPEKQAEPKKDEDVVMVESEEAVVIPWEEYDFTKPTDCDHANCLGCNATATYDEDGWVVLGSAEKMSVEPVY